MPKVAQKGVDKEMSVFAEEEDMDFEEEVFDDLEALNDD